MPEERYLSLTRDLEECLFSKQSNTKFQQAVEDKCKDCNLAKYISNHVYNVCMQHCMFHTQMFHIMGSAALPNIKIK